MKSKRVRSLVFIGVLAAMGFLISLIAFPYPPAPWLKIDLSEIVVLVAIMCVGYKGSLMVILVRLLLSLVIKGPEGPLAVGQLAQALGSISIAFSYYLITQVGKKHNIKISYGVTMVITMLIFTIVMVVANYVFITPTYLKYEPTFFWQLDLTKSLVDPGFDVTGILPFLSNYAKGIIFIYFPFNFIKGLVVASIHRFLLPLEKRYENVFK